MKKVDLTNEEYRELYIKAKLGTASEQEMQKLLASERSKLAMWDFWESNPTGKSGGIARKQELLKGIREQMHGSSSGAMNVRRRIRWQRYAAIFIFGLMVAAASIYFGVIQSGNPGNFRHEIASGESVGMSYTLSDGTRVTLNEESVIRYPGRFAFGKRNVSLEGEAFFEVASHPRKVFRVHTRDIMVEVLGTTFNVQANADESTTEISLIEGKVRVSRKNPATGNVQHVVLTPGHKATFLPSEERFVLDRIQASAEIPWTQAPIVLDDQRLGKVADLISERYSVTVQFSDEEIRDLRLSMQIDDESLEETLTIISKVLFLEYEINEQVVSISRSNPGNQE